MGSARGRRGLGVVTLATLFAACGVPTGEDTFTAIPPEEVPFGLDVTSTSTSTTTTVAEPTVTSEVTTTTPIRLDPAEVYFLSRGRLQALVVELPPGFSAEQVADVLEAGPPPDVGLDSLIAEGLIVATSESRAVLTVDLDPDTFARIPTTQQTEAIAQIVTTMISSLRRIGLVSFTIAGEPISVKKGNSLLSEVGEPLTYDDYVVLLASPPPAIEPTLEPTVESALESESTTPDQ